MSISLNLHGIQSIALSRKTFDAHTSWTAIRITDRDGDRVEVTCFDPDVAHPAVITTPDSVVTAALLAACRDSLALMNDNCECTCEIGHICWQCSAITATEDAIALAEK